jgi:serine/threonine protein phosphatase PrpC
MFETGSATHVGKVRRRNEDSYLVRPDAALWAVADGMGGHEAGDVASQTVIGALRSVGIANSATDLLDMCEERLACANMQLKEIGRQRGGVIVGATVALLLAFGDYYACVWAGDSRIYVVRDGKIVQLSHDHTELEELLAKGVVTREEAETWHAANALTRAIGASDEVELEITSGPLMAGDAFVICSDGLTRHVTDAEILAHVTDRMSQAACDRLVALTLERGATDNVTVIVVRFVPEPAEPVASFGCADPAVGEPS